MNHKRADSECHSVSTNGL